MTRDSLFVTNISGDASLRQAQEIALQLKAALAGHQIVAVATNDLTRVDITTVQLLLAARKQAIAAGKSFILAEPAQGALRELLVQIGILDRDGMSASSDADFWLHDPQTKDKAA